MGGDMIEFTKDMDLVKEIITEPSVWDRAAEDGIDPESYYPNYDAMSIWLLCNDGENIGIILVHTDTLISVKIHIYPMEKHRKKAKYMMEEFYKWFLEHEIAIKVNATIPKLYPEVITFAKKVGFKEEGVNTLSYFKNGNIYDQINLGINRTQIKEYLNGNISRRSHNRTDRVSGASLSR